MLGIRPRDATHLCARIVQELTNPREKARLSRHFLRATVAATGWWPRSGCHFRGRSPRWNIRSFFNSFGFRFDHVVVAHVNFSKLVCHFCFAIQLAGVPGFEPGLSVLETDVLAVDTIPLCPFSISDCRFSIGPLRPRRIGNWQSPIGNYLVSLCDVCLRHRRQNLLNSNRSVVVFLFFVVT